MCELVISNKSRKFLNKLDNKTKKRIKVALDNLVENPFDSTKNETGKLNKFKKNHLNDRYRLRVGELRVVYQFENENSRIMVLEMSHRGNICKYK